MPNQNQLNSPKTEKKAHPNWFLEKAQANTHNIFYSTYQYSNGIFFFSSFSPGLSLSLVHCCHKAWRGPQKCKACHNTVFPERTERKSSDGCAGWPYTHIRVFRDAVADSSLCHCLGSLFDTGGGNRRPDGLTGGVTDRLPGSDPYPLNTLDARAPFRAKGSPDLCLFAVLGTPFLSAVLLL